jgi:hypothetical protein
MRAFEIEIKIAGQPEKIQVEELDPWPDADGFVRYAVSGDRGRSVMAINQIYWEKPFIMTEQDAWDYLERVLYPEFPRVYSEDFVFTADEQEHIGNAIGKYLMAIKS